MGRPYVIDLRVEIAQSPEYTAALKHIVTGEPYGILRCDAIMPIDGKKGYAVISFESGNLSWRGLRFPGNVPVCQVAFSKRSAATEEIIGCMPTVEDAAKVGVQNLESIMNLLDDPDGTVKKMPRREFNVSKYDLAHFIAYSIQYAYFGKEIVNVPIRVTASIGMHLNIQHPSDIIFPAPKKKPEEKIYFDTSVRTAHKRGYLYADTGDNRDIDVDNLYQEGHAIAIDVSIKSEMPDGHRMYMSYIVLRRKRDLQIVEEKITEDLKELSMSRSFTKQIVEQFKDMTSHCTIMSTEETPESANFGQVISLTTPFAKDMWPKFKAWLVESSPIAETLAVTDSIFEGLNKEDIRAWDLWMKQLIGV